MLSPDNWLFLLDLLFISNAILIKSILFLQFLSNLLISKLFSFANIWISIILTTNIFGNLMIARRKVILRAKMILLLDRLPMIVFYQIGMLQRKCALVYARVFFLLSTVVFRGNLSWFRWINILWNLFKLI